MPCATEQCGSNDEFDDLSDDINDKVSSLKRKARYYKQKADEATAHLCYALSNNHLSFIPAQLNMWWKNHEEVDKKRNEK